MMRRTAAAAGAVCLSCAIVLHATEPPFAPPPDVRKPGFLYVRSPSAVKRLALDYAGIASDVYWIRALQHFGREHLAEPPSARNYNLLYPLLDLTTTLDPYFNIAYRFGAIYLGEPFPDGPGRPDLAIALLNKGLQAQPRKWQYMQDLGFVYYWHLHDYHSAANWFERAADISGAPSWLRPLAAVTLAEGGHTGASRMLWEQLAKSGEPWLRDSATRRLEQLDAMDFMTALESRIRAYHASHPDVPLTWTALARAGVVSGAPEDPSGAPYLLDPRTGEMTVSPDSGIYPLPGQLGSDR
jgi:tetratricopeptide (TPR) repeat protein